MRRNTTSKILASVAVFGVVAAGGSAFTASSGLPQTPKTVGYDTTTISGATATDLSYDLSADGTKIVKAQITFNGDQTTRTIKAGFNLDTLTACDAAVPGDFAAGKTLIKCTFDQDTEAADTFKVAVN
jgi:hypothetical protein